MSLFTRFWSDRSAATAIEYGLIASLIALVIIGATRGVGTNLNAKFNTIKNNLT
jgi:pilus assembly protein Flp/PilA